MDEVRLVSAKPGAGCTVTIVLWVLTDKGHDGLVGVLTLNIYVTVMGLLVALIKFPSVRVPPVPNVPPAA